MIDGINEIRRAYQDAGVARRYVDERFATPLGALLHRRQAKVVRRVITALRRPRVLEIAPGPARLTRSFLDVAGHTTLLDASAEMLDEAKGRLSDSPVRWTLVRGNAFQLPFGSQFDVVCCFRFIRHFGPDDRRRLYGEITRVLRPGGMLVFDAVNERVHATIRATARDLRHYDAAFHRDELIAELAEHGLIVDSLAGAQHHYRVLYQLQVLGAPRSSALTHAAMRIIDGIGGGNPLEWIATCHRA